MTDSTSAADVAAIAATSTVLFLATALPLMRWAGAEHLLPRPVREAPLTAAALLLILTAAPEATR